MLDETMAICNAIPIVFVNTETIAEAISQLMISRLIEMLFSFIWTYIH